MTDGPNNEQAEAQCKVREESHIGLGVALGLLFGMMLGQLVIGLSLGLLGGILGDGWRERGRGAQ